MLAGVPEGEGGGGVVADGDEIEEGADHEEGPQEEEVGENQSPHPVLERFETLD